MSDHGDGDDDFIGLLFEWIVAMVIIAIEVSIQLVIVICMAITFIFEMFFEDWGDDD